jgi:hypothetical protein
MTDRVEIDDAYLGGEPFGGVSDAGCSHQVISTGAGPAAATRTPTFEWFNTALGNIKPSIAGTNRTINTMDVSRHLAELEYRFSSTGDTISPPLSRALHGPVRA